MQISISDTGPGVPSAIADRIFDPFLRQAGRPGNRLGAILSYGIVSDHRGRIEVRNDSVGAVFDIYLPAVGLGESVHEGSTMGIAGKILIVDDEQDALTIADGFSAVCRMTAWTECDPSRALEIIQRERPG